MHAAPASLQTSTQSLFISRCFSSQAFDGDFVIAAGDTINVWTAPGNFLSCCHSLRYERNFLFVFTCMQSQFVHQGTHHIWLLRHKLQHCTASDRIWQTRPNPARPGALGRQRHTTFSGSTRTASPVDSLVCKLYCCAVFAHQCIAECTIDALPSHI